MVGKKKLLSQVKRKRAKAIIGEQRWKKLIEKYPGMILSIPTIDKEGIVKTFLGATRRTRRKYDAFIYVSKKFRIGEERIRQILKKNGITVKGGEVHEEPKRRGRKKGFNTSLRSRRAPSRRGG